MLIMRTKKGRETMKQKVNEGETRLDWKAGTW